MGKVRLKGVHIPGNRQMDRIVPISGLFDCQEEARTTSIASERQQKNLLQNIVQQQWIDHGLA